MSIIVNIMDLVLKWIICVSAVAGFMSIIFIKDSIDCDPIVHNLVGKCHDIPEAVDFLHDLLPDEMPLQDRCKRYALVSQTIKEKRLPSRLELFTLSELPQEVVFMRYLEIDPRDLSDFFMTAIDGYRASELSPPVLELYECLSSINTSYGEIYLSNPELTLTLDLYRQLRESPEMKIDLNRIELRNFHPVFRTRLEFLFKNHLNESDICSNESNETKSRRGRPVLEPSPGPLFPPASRRRELLDAGFSEEQIQEQRKKRKRQKGIERLRRMREAYPHRHREQERLRQQRLRILNPELVRDRVRRWDRRRRENQKERLEEQRKRIHSELERHMKERQQQHLRTFAKQKPSLTLESSGSPRTAEAAGASAPASVASLPAPLPESEVSLLLSVARPHDSRQQQQRQEHMPPLYASNAQQVQGLFGSPTRVDPQQTTYPTPQQPLVRPMTSYPSFLLHMDPEVGAIHSSRHNHSVMPELLTGVGSHQQVASDQILQDTDRHSGRQTYRYIVETPEAHAPSGSLMSTLHAIEPFAQQLSQSELGTFDDVTSFSKQLDDTDEVVRSIAEQPAPPTTGTVFGTDLDLENPWWDFDRQFSKRHKQQ